MTLDRLALSREDLDRAGHRRTDTGWLDAAWADPRTRVLVVSGGEALVGYEGEAARLRLLSPSAAPAGERFFLGVTDPDQPDGAVRGEETAVGTRNGTSIDTGIDTGIGTEDGTGPRAETEGVAYFAVAADSLPEDAGDAPGGAVAAGLRDVGALLDDREAGLLVHAVALTNWHATHRYCPRCGAPTVPAAGGHLRRCSAEGSEHYPRTDPAVIMAVVDEDDRILLGHSARWPARRFSTLAGFVEPGESLEAAVRREVLEESGVIVGAVEYQGSQPWPFPSSLMLGFRAKAVSTRIAVDGDELGEARWFRRDVLAEASRHGQVLLPPPVSIARRLIEHWYGGPLDALSSAWRPEGAGGDQRVTR